jgi:hypothetical protein
MRKVQKQVYIGIDANGLFKIGIAADWEKRQRVIQSMNPGFHIIYVWTFENAFEVERHLHHRYKDKNVGGEWFRFNWNEYLEFLTYVSGGNLSALGTEEEIAKQLDSITLACVCAVEGIK